MADITYITSNNLCPSVFSVSQQDARFMKVKSVCFILILHTLPNSGPPMQLALIKYLLN